MSYTIDFYSYDHPFCEVNIYGSPPEYINCLSALFISFIGMFAIYFNIYNKDITNLYMALIINGITSFYYHYTNIIGWGLMDRFSMVLIANSCMNIFLSILQKMNINKYILITFRLLLTSYITFLLTACGLHHEDLFNNLFGIFLGSLILFMIFISLTRYRFRIPRNIFNNGWKGIGIIALGGIVWIITENYCHSIFLMKYLLGHAIWHVCVGFGGYLISLVALSLIVQPVINVSYFFGIPYLYPE